MDNQQLIPKEEEPPLFNSQPYHVILEGSSYLPDEEAWSTDITTDESTSRDLRKFTLYGLMSYTRSQSEIGLRDPFELSEEEMVRWYVEDYARLSPYEKTKAAAAKKRWHNTFALYLNN